MNQHDAIVALSHAFGTPDFVCGGGGNSSVKDAETLWIKPSGTTLTRLQTNDLVPLRRKDVEAIFHIATPDDATSREAMVKDMLQAAVIEGSGRPSVESPLHHAFDASFVLHLHPAFVGGLVCARNGRAACQTLFPEALWIDYVDPGYTLAIEARQALKAYNTKHGRQPSIVFQQNHGVFVAAEDTDTIAATYRHIMSTLENAYDAAGISTTLEIAPPRPTTTASLKPNLSNVLGDEATYCIDVGGFTPPQGPLTPDHIVYMKSYPLTDPVDASSVRGFVERHGYAPRIVQHEGQVFAVAGTEQNARLASELVRDGALVVQLTEAFGGVLTMSDRAREFVEQWEVEAYRQKIAAGE